MHMGSSQMIGIFVRLGLLVLIGVAAYYILSFALPLLYPFLIGWLIAMAIEPAVRFMEHKLRLPRWAGVSLMLIMCWQWSLHCWFCWSRKSSSN